MRQLKAEIDMEELRKQQCMDKMQKICENLTLCGAWGLLCSFTANLDWDSVNGYTF